MIHKNVFAKRMFCIILAILFLAMGSGCSAQAISSADTTNVLMPGSPQAEKIGTSISSPPKDSSALAEGYRAICDAGSTYIAVGTGGRIDKIKPDKTVTRVSSATKACLNDVISLNGTDIAVGDQGTILIAKDGGSFQSAKSGTKKSLFSVTSFRESFWAAGAGGVLLRSADGKQWEAVDSGIKNNILSISANEKMCMAVTREGQILMSTDGSKWNITDYNKIYEGYSELFWFKSVRGCGDVFFIAGVYQKNPGIPAILSSDTGEVWREAVLKNINDKPAEEFFPLAINAITVDWDQLVAAGNGGKLLTVTDCSECNKLDTLDNKNINDMVSANGYLALVGDGFWFDVRKSDAFRQYNIKAEQALKDYKNGAYIVDVRTDDEYNQKHIKGAIHIPVDTVEAELGKWIPDKSSKIIFYCAKGVRAQKALEKALLLGYEKVYNLGGISDWSYDTEAGTSSGQ
jgi:phage shock protein E